MTSRYRIRYKYAYSEPEYEGCNCDFYTTIFDAQNASTAVQGMIEALQKFKSYLLEESAVIDRDSKVTGYQILQVWALPALDTTQVSEERIKKIKDEYLEEANSMTEQILYYLEEGLDLTNEEIQALLEFAGDEDFAGPEDIREEAERKVPAPVFTGPNE